MADTRYVCSVDIGGTKIASAIMEYPADGSRTHPVYSAEVPTNPSEGGEAVYSRIEGAIREALASAAPMSRPFATFSSSAVCSNWRQLWLIRVMCAPSISAAPRSPAPSWSIRRIIGGNYG